MNFDLSQKDFISRAKDLSRNNLLFIFSIIKAASIGLGISVFLNLFIDFGPEWSWQNILAQVPKFLLWITSYGGLLVTFDTAMFASLFLTHMPKRSETFFTFLLIGLEALQFAILKPSNNKIVIKVASVQILDWWFLIFSIYCLTIFALIKYAKGEIKPVGFGPFSGLVKKYIAKFKIGMFLSLLGFFTSISIFLILSLTKTKSYYITLIASILFSIGLYIAFEIHHKLRRSFEIKIKEITLKKNQDN